MQSFAPSRLRVRTLLNQALAVFPVPFPVLSVPLVKWGTLLTKSTYAFVEAAHTLCDRSSTALCATLWLVAPYGCSPPPSVPAGDTAPPALRFAPIRVHSRLPAFQAVTVPRSIAGDAFSPVIRPLPCPSVDSVANPPSRPMSSLAPPPMTPSPQSNSPPNTCSSWRLCAFA